MLLVSSDCESNCISTMVNSDILPLSTDVYSVTNHSVNLTLVKALIKGIKTNINSEPLPES